MSSESLQPKLLGMRYWFEDKPVSTVFLEISWDEQDQRIPQAAILTGNMI